MLPLEEDQQPCCPVSVHFGLPLFDLQLNKQICGQIKDHGLFTEASMAQHSLNSRLLALDLLEFIRTQLNKTWTNFELSLELVLSVDADFVPASPLQFYQGVLTEFDIMASNPP